MFFALNTYLWSGSFGRHDLPLIDKIDGFGADAIELACARLDTFPTKEIRSALAGRDLTPILCTSPAVPRDAAVGDDDPAYAIDFLRRAIAAADAIGAKLVVGPLYAPVWWFQEQRLQPRQFARMVEVFQSVTPDLEATGIELAIEPLNRFETFVVNTARQTASLCEAIGHPSIGMMLDTAHMASEEKDPVAAIVASRKWLKHLQTPETDRGTPGTGRLIDWPGLFRALREIGYGGGCSIESFAFDDPNLTLKMRLWRDLASAPDEIAAKGLAFLRQCHADASMT